MFFIIIFSAMTMSSNVFNTTYFEYYCSSIYCDRFIVVVRMNNT